MRKVVQLQVWSGDLLAVCDDGTIWRRSIVSDQWVAMDGPPVAEAQYGVVQRFPIDEPYLLERDFGVKLP